MSIPADHDDIESTKIELIEHNNTSTQTEGSSTSTRKNWRQILLLFRAYLRMKYCITNNGATNTSFSDPAYDESPSYTTLSNDGYDNHADQLDDNHHDIHSEDSISNDNPINSNNNNGNIQEVVPLPVTSIGKDTLIRILKEMNFVTLSDHGGVEGIASSLGSNLKSGISFEGDDDLQLRRTAYGTNTYRLESVISSKSFFYFLLKACKDLTIILLLCCAIISLASGLKEEGQKNGWYDGTLLFIMVFILVFVTSFRNYFRSRKPQKLQPNKNNSGKINVVRQGVQQEVSVSQVVVGDLVFLSLGDWVPSDGLFVNGDDLKVDDGVLHHMFTINDVQNPFLYHGAKVIHGSGHMLVTSVGVNTIIGDMMSKVTHDTSRKRRPLQAQVDKMNTYLQNIGLFLGVLILLVLLFRYFRGKMDDETGYPDQISKRTAAGDLMKAVEGFIKKPRGIFASLTNVLAVLLVGLHEGLPLIISLSLSYWNNRISKDHQVTISDSFGITTLGSTTSFIIDTATLNQMKVDIFCADEENMRENSVPVLSSEEIKTTVDALQNAGVSIKLVSAENLAMVMPIADEYGIFLSDGQASNDVVLEGEVFRNYSDLERMEIADRMTIMGSASPSDKLLLVQSLRQKDQVVVVMGTRIAELPSLREADVGIFMGANNSEMTKESSDIIILNGNFASVNDALSIGRSIYQNIRKFLQLELTTNIAAILITFVTTVCLGDTPITPFQLFLVNLTLGTLAALALLTEPSTNEVLEMQPINQSQPIISKAMRRNIFVQVSYQGIVLLICQFIKGQDFLGLIDPKVKKAMIFNGFVLCLVFNQFNAREPEKKNVFMGITGSRWFLIYAGGSVILEVLVMEFAERVTGFPRLNKMQWLACISFAMMSCPIDYAAKCISSFFANRSISFPSQRSSTESLESTLLTSLDQLPTPLMNV